MNKDQINARNRRASITPKRYGIHSIVTFKKYWNCEIKMIDLIYGDNRYLCWLVQNLPLDSISRFSMTPGAKSHFAAMMAYHFGAGTQEERKEIRSKIKEATQRVKSMKSVADELSRVEWNTMRNKYGYSKYNK